MIQFNCQKTTIQIKQFQHNFATERQSLFDHIGQLKFKLDFNNHEQKQKITKKYKEKKNQQHSKK